MNFLFHFMIGVLYVVGGAQILAGLIFVLFWRRNRPKLVAKWSDQNFIVCAIAGAVLVTAATFFLLT